MSRRSRNARALTYSRQLTELPRAHESVRREFLHDLLLEMQDSVRGVRAEHVPRSFVARDSRRSRVFSYRTIAAPRAPRRRADALYALKVLQLRAPSRVQFCVRRKVRRSVLFALDKAGYRGSGPGVRGYRRTQDSQYRC